MCKKMADVRDDEWTALHKQWESDVLCSRVFSMSSGKHFILVLVEPQVARRLFLVVC